MEDTDPLELVARIRLRCFGGIHKKKPYRHLKILAHPTKGALSIGVKIVRYAQTLGIKPAERYFGCSRNTVRKWPIRNIFKCFVGLTRKGNVDKEEVKEGEKVLGEAILH